ncbi:MAG: MotA/TolQ/ExbB proton channel family protein [Verrucomicrobiae bacterium]|nr:MotA/TolQ/ExbB proton channel family protein [Verrucomicrobiae bacterium]
MMKQSNACKTWAAATLATALLAGTVMPAILLAQEAKSPAAKAAPPAPAKSAPAEQKAPAPQMEETTVMGFLKAGGWCMWPLGACSVACVGLLLYNALSVRAGRLLRPDVATRINDALERLDIEGAREICKSNVNLVSSVTMAGLERIKDGNLDVSSVEKGMEEATSGEIAIHLLPINWISVIAVVSPMFGLLGTVSGMIGAFRTMSMSGMGRPELLSANISEALITTEVGLAIGIPSMIGYFYFKYQYMGIVSTLNRICGGFLQTMRDSLRRMEAGMMPSAQQQYQPEAAPEA